VQRSYSSSPPERRRLPISNVEDWDDRCLLAHPLLNVQPCDDRLASRPIRKGKALDDLPAVNVGLVVIAGRINLYPAIGYKT
jgi:hypothetical protein